MRQFYRIYNIDKSKVVTNLKSVTHFFSGLDNSPSLTMSRKVLLITLSKNQNIKQLFEFLQEGVDSFFMLCYT